jgi:hypothetical protein
MTQQQRAGHVRTQLLEDRSRLYRGFHHYSCLQSWLIRPYPETDGDLLQYSWTATSESTVQFSTVGHVVYL